MAAFERDTLSSGTKNGNAPLQGIRKGSREWNRLVRQGLIKED